MSLMMRLPLISFLVLFGALVLSPSIEAYAHQGASGIVKDRMDRFVQTKDDLRAAFRDAKDGSFDKVIIKSRRIDEWGRVMPDFFPEGSNHPPSEAAPTIWEDFSGFVAAGLAMSTAAQNVISSAGQSDTDATLSALKALGQTCGACHRQYRQ